MNAILKFDNLKNICSQSYHQMIIEEIKKSTNFKPVNFINETVLEDLIK